MIFVVGGGVVGRRCSLLVSGVVVAFAFVVVEVKVFIIINC